MWNTCGNVLIVVWYSSLGARNSLSNMHDTLHHRELFSRLKKNKVVESATMQSYPPNFVLGK